MHVTQIGTFAYNKDTTKYNISNDNDSNNSNIVIIMLVII
jgi:hypothetical protein